MLSGLGKFANSSVGQLLTKFGLDSVGGALTPEDGPARFADLKGEKGRLLKPENAAYNHIRTLLATQLGLGRQAEAGVSLKSPMPGRTSQIDIPGLPFSLGGVGQEASQFGSSLPGLNTSVGGQNQLSGLLEGLLRPPPPQDLVPGGLPQPGQAPQLPTARNLTPSNTARRRSPR